MSARLAPGIAFRPMTHADLEVVMAIERAIYPHPWTRGNFRDSLEAGYHCWILECDSAPVGYCVIMTGAAEAHLLNLSIAAAWQRRGFGLELLAFAAGLARRSGASRLFLEVRRSNAPAQALYVRAGFRQIGVRHGYYPAGEQREDALVFELELGADVTHGA